MREQRYKLNILAAYAIKWMIEEIDQVLAFITYRYSFHIKYISYR